MNKKFKFFSTIDKREIIAVNKVLKNKKLSSFVASKNKDFTGSSHDGGKKIIEFERKICQFFNVKYSLVVNSWTSGLVCIVGSLQLEPGDEIILPTWTMSACASSILHWNCIPVFVDIDKNNFCLDIKDVEKKISKKTKAIMAVDIFGQSANYSELKKISKKYNLKLISDTAQAIGSKYKEIYSGTVSDIGGFSLNHHKHIQTAEGGIIVTNNKNLYEKCKLIRNHAEVTVGNIKSKNKFALLNMIGENFRMGEIEAAIGIEQLKKLKKIIENRQSVAKKIINGLKGLKGLKIPSTEFGNTNSYYVLPLVVDTKIIKTKRDQIVSSLNKIGLECFFGGYLNLHRLPTYKHKIAYGKKGFPWNLTQNGKNIKYKAGSLPIAEHLHNNSFIGLEMCMYELSNKEISKLIKSFKKVWSKII